MGVDIPTKPITNPTAPSGPKVKLLKQFPHAYPNNPETFSEVNVARYNPFDHQCYASIADSGDVLIFETGKNVQELSFHTKQGYAMDWNSKQSGILATGSEDTTIAIWDINAASTSPLHTLNSTHSGTVHAVKWSPHLPTVLASVSEDGTLVFSDTRSTIFSTPIIRVENAHHVSDSSTSNSETEAEGAVNGKKPESPNQKQENGNGFTVTNEAQAEGSKYAAINDISFNPKNEYLLATASSDKTAALWDLRRMDRSIYSLVGHSAGVTSIQWSPHNESVLATAGYDRRVMIWDLSRIGSQDQDEEDEDPPELLFVHGGHTSNITAFEWHPTLPWVIASVAEDNIVQVWKPAQNIVKSQEEKEEEDEVEENGESDGSDK